MLGWAIVDLSGTVLHDTYRLERLLGEGGMGEVYLASHLRLARKFAVKLLIPEAANDVSALQRFQREAQVTSKLGHPHIVEVTDTNITPEGRPYLVMELLQGEDLANHLERQGAMVLPAIVSILRQVTSALHAAHQEGVVHRDLKPENVFLCRRGGRDDYVKLLDFGISKVLGSGTVETKRRTLVGSPCYMSPEQADERTTEVDVRTDVYAVGTMLYEMLVGAPPFTAASLPSLLYKIVHQAPPDVMQIRKDVSLAMAQVVGVAMDKDPDLRFQSVEELWLAFAEAVEAEGMALEKTEISHTAWPEHPPLAMERAGELSTSGQVEVAAPPVPLQQVEVSASLQRQVGRSTTLSASAGELKLGRPRRRPLLAVVVGASLISLSLGIFGVLYLTGEPQAPTVGAGGEEAGDGRASAVDGAHGARDGVPDIAFADAPPRPDASHVPHRSPPVKKRMGYLTVGSRHKNSTPVADIYLDGKKVGQTPAVLKVPPGLHRLELRRFGLRATRMVRVWPGKRQSIALDLAPGGR